MRPHVVASGSPAGVRTVSAREGFDVSLLKRGDIWHYDFWFQGLRYAASTRQTARSDANACEQEVKRKLRRQLAGLEGPPAAEAPRFQDWAEVHFRERRQHMTRPEFLEHNLRTVLRFWGARPKDDTTLADPYHDLRLHHPIRDPIWIERFEAWMRGRGSSPQTRNHYRSVLRGLYKTALLPAYRAASGVTVNPFRDVPRDTVVERTVTISIEDLRSWLKNASYHVRLAVAIAALAPKLRLANVLALTWHEHIDPDFRFITVHHHKTSRTLRRPHVVPISEQLRVILRDARQRTHTYVVEYRQRPVKSVRGGLQLAAERAGLPYGRAVDGATFHTLRHTAASLLAELGEPEAIRKEVMGHRDITTTQRYTHLRPVHEIPAHERLADAVPIADLVTATRKRASGKGVGTFDGTHSGPLEETRGKTGPDRRLATRATGRLCNDCRSRDGASETGKP
jgi:integrase